MKKKADVNKSAEVLALEQEVKRRIVIEYVHPTVSCARPDIVVEETQGTDDGFHASLSPLSGSGQSSCLHAGWGIMGGRYYLCKGQTGKFRPNVT